MIPSLRLSAEDLAVARGGRRIFERIAFTAGPGDYVEITGPNGAGKTSLLRVLAGLLRPLEGRVAMSSNFGPIPADEQGLCMHLVGHRDGLKGPLSVADHVSFWAGLYEGADEIAVLERVGLKRLSDRLARTLSAGQARRLALSRLLIAPRPVWLLDEPAASLDIAGRAWLLGLVSDHLASGGIVVAAVHDPIGAVPDHRVMLNASIMADAS
jgi:heme exporter protein A